MAKVEKKTLAETFTQERGWGHEKWVENCSEYCGKLLTVNPGKRGSLHFHVNKMETMLVQSGRATLMFIDTETAQEYHVTLDVGDSVLIEPGQPHQIQNNESTPLVIVEFSTYHEEEDSRRIRKGD